MKNSTLAYIALNTKNSTKTHENEPSKPMITPTPPPILLSETEVAIKRLKRDKAPGDDGITVATLQDGGKPIASDLTNLYNQCLNQKRVPSAWKNAPVILIHKKGDTGDIKKLPTN